VKKESEQIGEQAEEARADSMEEGPLYASSSAPLSAELRGEMTGVTWTHDCPVHLNDLRLLEVSFWDFSGDVQTGQLVVAKSAVEVLDEVFRVAFETAFPFERIEPASAFGGSDSESMAANNTSAFNCRAVTGGQSWSQHSYGNAVDINPIQNPYVKGSTTLPPEGESYRLRDPSEAGLLHASSPVVLSFKQQGWGWGGDWSSLKDYQHFSANGN
jgi:poly-gamma-glutamate synthesis protein (capsule biosynthesis protein)